MSWRGAFAAAFVMLAAAVQADSPPEPDGYRMDDYRAPTPATLSGATVLDTEAAAALWREGYAVFVDVLPRRVKPATLPEGTVWRDKKRNSVPGSIWLANAGYGALAAPLEASFREALDVAEGGGLVFFCLRDCWMSWNAAKRALSYGHENVYWYPDGTDGWAEELLPLERIYPAEGF